LGNIFFIKITACMPLSKSQNWKNKRFEHQEHNLDTIFPRVPLPELHPWHPAKKKLAPIFMYV
jgi:hypothetical protein